MAMVSLRLFRRTITINSSQTSRSVLDIPLGEYDEDTGLPLILRVGDKERAPFVSLQEVKDHLTFLSAIWRIQATLPPAENDNLQSLLDLSTRPYAHWAQHVLPLCQGSAQLTSAELPSLGVLMAWHSHLLNPTTYETDLEGAYKGLRGYDFPLREIAVALREHHLPPDQPISTSDEAALGTTAWSPEDIAKAIQRQSKFIGNMNRIGWRDDTHWASGWKEIQFGIVLYHAWLDLHHSLQSRQFLVPRLDIDLAWHTHQLHHERYRADTTELLGKMLNHNDMAGEGKLDDGLKTTRMLWKKKFGYEYQ